MSGWIKIHRSITNHWLYTEKRKFSKFEAWNDILLTVNFSPAKTIIKGKIINVNRGESILSLESWSERWRWNKSSVKRFFELLKKDGMIEVKSETVTTRLTVCKFDSYQSKENESETQVKRRRNASETHVKPIEEEEERKEEKEQDNSFSFESFWNIYDKKVDKTKCEVKFNKLSFDEKEKIKLILPKYIKSTPEVKYRKNPLTWLNGKCWNDEVVEVKEINPYKITI